METYGRIDRASIYFDRVVVDLKPGTGESPIEIPIRMDRTRVELIVTSPDPAHQPASPGVDKVLIRALVRAFAMRMKLECGEACSDSDLMAQFGLAKSYVRKILPIGFLAPDLIEQILDARQPVRLQIGHICDGKLPLDWAGQRALFARLQR